MRVGPSCLVIVLLALGLSSSCRESAERVVGTGGRPATGGGVAGQDGSTGGVSPTGGSQGGAGAGGQAGASGPGCGESDCWTMLSAVVRGTERVGVRFAGRGTKAEVAELVMETLDGGGLVVTTFRNGRMGRSTRFAPEVNYGETSFASDGTFSGYWVVDITKPVARVRVKMMAADGTLYSPREVEPVVPSPRAGALGELCDYDGLFVACPQGSFCDRRDGSDQAICVGANPEVECPPDWQVLALGAESASGDLMKGKDVTLGSCTNQRGDLGVEEVYRYVPERSGTFVFRVMGAAATVYARRYCSFPRELSSELGCTRIAGAFPTSSQMGELELTLEAGKPVFLFVEAPWFGGGAYSLVAIGQ